MRPRIRTIKPEMRQDERYGALSRDARELFNGLITLADDEGRFLARPMHILGHVFPHDDDAASLLDGWLDELRASGMVLLYEHGGVPYGAFRHWRKHQRINRPTDSILPPPPDPSVVAANRVSTSVNTVGEFTERSMKTGPEFTPSCAGVRSAPGPGPFLSNPTDLNDGETATIESAEPPRDFPTELAPHLDLVLAVLEPLAQRHGAKAVTRQSLACTIADPTRRHKPFVRAAHDFAAWADGKATRRRDVLAGYRNWLERCDDLAGVERLAERNGKAPPVARPAALERMDAWRRAPEYQQEGVLS